MYMYVTCLPIHINMQAASREHLGHKLIRQMTQSLSVQPSSTADRAEQIVALARVRHRMKVVSTCMCVYIYIY